MHMKTLIIFLFGVIKDAIEDFLKKFFSDLLEKVRDEMDGEKPSRPKLGRYLKKTYEDPAKRLYEPPEPPGGMRIPF